MQKRARREAGPFGEKLDGVIDSKGRNTFNRAFGYRSSRVHFYITSGVLQLSTGSSRVAFGHGVRTVEGYAMGIAETLDTDTDTGSAASCGVVQDGFIAGGDTGNVYSQASNRLPCAQSVTLKPKS